MRSALVAVSVLILLSGIRPDVRAEGPRTVTATATLSILSGTVKQVPAGGGQPQTARDGMDLAVGDRILTGPKSEAVVTFLDGSTLTVMPDSDVAVRQAVIGNKGAGSKIGIQINLGKVWARVVKVADPHAGFSLESNTATATVHDGLIGGQQDADDTFSCWTKSGGMQVKDRQGRTIVLIPGEKTVVKAGQTLVPQPFAVNQSVLKIAASPNVLPLLLMADKARVAGFVAPGLEVNQVFGSFTSAGPLGLHIIEVPAGVSGPFTLVLEGVADGPFTVEVSGLFKGGQVYQQELSGTIKKGERLTAAITQQLDPATAADPKTARLSGGKAEPLTALEGAMPGTILLSPQELEAAGRPQP